MGVIWLCTSRFKLITKFITIIYIKYTNTHKIMSENMSKTFCVIAFSNVLRPKFQVRMQLYVLFLTLTETLTFLYTLSVISLISLSLQDELIALARNWIRLVSNLRYPWMWSTDLTMAKLKTSPVISSTLEIKHTHVGAPTQVRQSFSCKSWKMIPG